MVILHTNKLKNNQNFSQWECDVFYLLINLAGTGVNRIIGGQDSDTTHYMDGKLIISNIFSIRKISERLCDIW